jgi:hypothetical protein
VLYLADMAERLAASRVARSRPVAGAAAIDNHAGLGARVLAFVLDSCVLLAFAAGFAAAAFLNIFLRTDSGRQNLTDAQVWTSVAILILAVPVWLAFNVVLTLNRGQTVGQYVVGLAVTREDGTMAGAGRLLLYWFALHPLLFHPVLLPFWAWLSYVALALTRSPPVVIAGLAMTLLCLIAPVVALVSASADGGRRALHDRVAALKVVRLE